MQIRKIFYTKTFYQTLSLLAPRLEKKFYVKLKLFIQNPFHPSLRMHKLSGKLLWYRSISIDKSVRVIFDVEENGDILFKVIGNHSVYEKLSRKK